jgi:hypothetical protein
MYVLAATHHRSVQVVQIHADPQEISDAELLANFSH